MRLVPVVDRIDVALRIHRHAFNEERHMPGSNGRQTRVADDPDVGVLGAVPKDLPRVAARRNRGSKVIQSIPTAAQIPRVEGFQRPQRPHDLPVGIENSGARKAALAKLRGEVVLRIERNRKACDT